MYCFYWGKTVSQTSQNPHSFLRPQYTIYPRHKTDKCISLAKYKYLKKKFSVFKFFAERFSSLQPDHVKKRTQLLILNVPQIVTFKILIYRKYCQKFFNVQNENFWSVLLQLLLKLLQQWWSSMITLLLFLWKCAKHLKK